MLFRTVYGPELEAIYRFLAGEEIPLPRRTIRAAFVPHSETAVPSTQNVDDALSFLQSARLVTEEDGCYRMAGAATPESFRITALRKLRSLELRRIDPLHPIDPLYMLILTELFIRPNRLFVADVHLEANNLRRVAEVGGLSREKLQSWKRVMEFLGLGRRMLDGFQCAVAPSLLLQILARRPRQGELLQHFFEEHLAFILPYRAAGGELAQAVQEPLQYLDANGLIALTARQDSPSKPYFGSRRARPIRWLEAADDTK